MKINVVTLFLCFVFSLIPSPASHGSGAVHPYTKAVFDQAMNTGRPVLLAFGAPRCALCEVQLAVLERLSEQEKFKSLLFLRVESDMVENVNRILLPDWQSTMILLHYGKELGRQIAETDPLKIERFLDDGLGLSPKNIPSQGRFFSYSEASFYNESMSDRIVVLVFSADACPTCHIQTKKLQSILPRLPNVLVLRVNDDNASLLSRRYTITTPGTLLVLSKGKELRRSVGMTDADDLVAFILGNGD